MSPAHVLEPTYRHLKHALVNGTWPNGAKLEAMRLADDLGVSMTPVRDSLNQLVGEGLVDLTPGEGFRVPLLTEQDLREFLHVNAVLLEAAIHENWSLPNRPARESHQGDYADRRAAVFSILATGSDNRVLTDMVERISQRLQPVRLREHPVLPKALQNLGRLETSLLRSHGDRHEALRLYHRHCEAYVPKLIGRLPD